MQRYAAVSAKIVTTVVSATAGIQIPDNLMVGGTMNFSAFAMIGHIIFMVPEANSTDALKKMREVFKGKSGGSRSILEFEVWAQWNRDRKG